MSGTPEDSLLAGSAEVAEVAGSVEFLDCKSQSQAAANTCQHLSDVHISKRCSDKDRILAMSYPGTKYMKIFFCSIATTGRLVFVMCSLITLRRLESRLLTGPHNI